MKKYVIVFMLLSVVVQANMTKEGFERFFNYYFVETGTNSGDGVKFALRAGFPKIFSVEVRREAYEDVKRVFAPYKNVEILWGDSGLILYDIIKDLDRPITFWLDGHIGEPIPGCVKHTPLFEELEQIQRHKIKHHTLIIDDMHCAGGMLFDFHTKEDIVAKIREINPKYVITYVNGGDDAEAIDNIMVAYVPFSDWER